MSPFYAAAFGAASELAQGTPYSREALNRFLRAADDAGMTLSEAVEAIGEASRRNLTLFEMLHSPESSQPADAATKVTRNTQVEMAIEVLSALGVTLADIEEEFDRRAKVTNAQNEGMR